MMKAYLNRVVQNREELLNQLYDITMVEYDLMPQYQMNFKIQLKGQLSPLKIEFGYPNETKVNVSAL